MVKFKHIIKNYIVGSDGTIWRVKKDGDINYVKPFKNKAGKYQVTLFIDGKGVTKLREKIVIEAFLGKKDLKIIHKDGDVSNDNLDNLYYV